MSNQLPTRRGGAIETLSRLQNDFDRLAREFFNFYIPAMPGRFTPEFSPSCEVSESKEAFTFKFDMPGVKKEDVKIELDHNKLTVSAERREEKKSEDTKFRMAEISYGSYERSFTLPSTVNDKNVDAKFADGVLTIVLPKAEETKTRKISVQ